MNGKSYLLDTNIIIISFKDKSLKSKIEGAESIFIPSTVIGELYFGAEKSKHKKENYKKIKVLIEESIILNCDSETARQYGIIKESLRKKGRPMPENDIWIAAISKQYGLELITRDDHFRFIDGLKTSDWK
jgi:tRNA(fMet)-specific endonuclease VapC